MRSVQTCALLILFAILPTYRGLQARADSPDDVRIVRERPTGGRYVETTYGFMVPYRQTIPGSDVAIEMLPIAGVPNSDGMSEPLWMGKHEVTLRAYSEFAKLHRVFNKLQANSIRRVTDAHAIDAVTAPTEIYDPQGLFKDVTSLESPAYSMTLYSAKQFSKWLSLITQRAYRLPTELEWEHACSAGGAASLQSLSNRPEEFAVFGNAVQTVARVGTKQPNAWGLHDMFGNASEWVITEFPDTRSRTSATAERWPPPWVSKGGNYAASIEQLHADARTIASNEYWSDDADHPQSVCWLANYGPQTCIGFRLVCQLGALDKESMKRFWDCESLDLRERVDTKVKEGRMKFGLVDSSLPEMTAQAVPTKDLWRLFPAAEPSSAGPRSGD